MILFNFWCAVRTCICQFHQLYDASLIRYNVNKCNDIVTIPHYGKFSRNKYYHSELLTCAVKKISALTSENIYF